MGLIDTLDDGIAEIFICYLSWGIRSVVCSLVVVANCDPFLVSGTLELSTSLPSTSYTTAIFLVGVSSEIDGEKTSFLKSPFRSEDLRINSWTGQE